MGHTKLFTLGFSTFSSVLGTADWNNKKDVEATDWPKIHKQSGGLIGRDFRSHLYNGSFAVPKSPVALTE